ncbi:GNAT family N-acetyltransferase [Aminipila butyrica]|uniref:GNAT family N-acetyltransferase n=1 Tax=Aminipila butyrica TaxID=433296 RepID=A0A858BWW1_9FIRM|nr:GNAT family N-acetyltransferase [Aminipila butyrica]QIB70057.1 GNAT family N-acetyltransferase [Aminipila butyrica]
MRRIQAIGPDVMEDYLEIYLNAYPAFKTLDGECYETYRKKTLRDMEEAEDVHFFGLYEEQVLIATMKLIEFKMNLFGQMQKAVGLMSLAVHPLHKKQGVALNMVQFFEEYTEKSGGLIALLLPFSMDFYRRMGYGFGSKLDEYHIPADSLPRDGELTHLKLLGKEDLPEVLACHQRYAKNNHGMLMKFSEEIRAMEADSPVRRLGWLEEGELKGYLAYRFICDSPMNYTLNHIEVDELIYENGAILKGLLNFLRMQADEAQSVVLRTGEEDFYHLLRSPQDLSNNYIPFGYLQSNVSAIGIMHKILSVEKFIQQTEYRAFPSQEVNLRISWEDELNHRQEAVSIAFGGDGKKGQAHWRVCSEEEGAFVEIRCKKSDLSSLLLGSCRFAAMIRLGVMEISDSTYIDVVDQLFYYRQKPWGNSDF